MVDVVVETLCCLLAGMRDDDQGPKADTIVPTYVLQTTHTRSGCPVIVQQYGVAAP